MPRIPKVWALGATFMCHLASGSCGVSGVLLLLGACRDPAHSHRLQSAPSIAWQLVETANGGGVWSTHVGCGRGCCPILSVGDGTSRGPGHRGVQPLLPLCHRSLDCDHRHVVHQVSPCWHMQWDSALSQGAVSTAAMFLLVIPPFLLADLPVRSRFSSQALIPIKASHESLAQPVGYGSRRGALGGSLSMWGQGRLQQRHARVRNQLHAPQPSAWGLLLVRGTSGSPITMRGCTPKRIWLGRSPSAEGSLA